MYVRVVECYMFVCLVSEWLKDCAVCCTCMSLLCVLFVNVCHVICIVVVCNVYQWCV